MTTSSRARLLTLAVGGASAIGLGVAWAQAQQPAPPPPPVERPSTRPLTQPAGGDPPQVIIVAPDVAGRWGTSSGTFARSSRYPFDPPYGYGHRQPEPFAPGDVAQRASCVLQIDSSTGRESGQPAGIDPNTVVGLLNSSAVIDAAVRQVLKLDPERQRQSVALTAHATGPRFAHVEVWLRKGGDLKPDAADALMKAAVERLRAAVAESVRVQQRSYDQRRAALEAELTDARAKLAENQRKVREYGRVTATMGMGGFGDVSGALGNLLQQRHQAEAELSRLRARLKAIEPEAASPLTDELAEIVRLRQQQLEETRKLAEKNAVEARRDRTRAEGRRGQGAARRPASRGDDGRRTGPPVVFGAETSNLRAQLAESETRFQTLVGQIGKLEDKSFQAARPSSTRNFSRRAIASATRCPS